MENPFTQEITISQEAYFETIVDENGGLKRALIDGERMFFLDLTKEQEEQVIATLKVEPIIMTILKKVHSDS